MSAGFETENLFLINEEEGSIVFYDALRFEATTLPLRSLGLILHQETFDAVSGFTLARVKKLQEDNSEDFDMQAVGASALAITHPLLPLSQQQWPTADFTPAAASSFVPGYDLKLWVLVSDEPRESFHAEDYEAKALESFDAEEHIVPIDFAVEIEALGGVIRHFPVGAEVNFDEVLAESGAEMFDEGARQAWALLSLPKGKTVTGALSPELPLPVLKEFVGPRGVGVDGKMVNLSLDLEPAAEFQCAVPFLRFQNVFVTLYGHLSQQEARDQSVKPWAPISDSTQTTKALEKSGFKLHASTDDSGGAAEYNESFAQIWNRDKDWVHLYHNPPGLEALGRDPLPSWLFAASANGSRDPEARAALVHTLIQ